MIEDSHNGIMNQAVGKQSISLEGNSPSTDIMNQDHDRPLDWNNAATLWTTPLHDLPLPPINSQSLSLSPTIPSQVNLLPVGGLPPVYPYIPSPSIGLLEQMETERKAETSDQNLPISSSRELDIEPPSSTPPRFDGFMSEFTAHNNSPWSAKSRISTDNASSSSPISTKEEDIKPAEKEEQEPTSATENEDVSCSTMYVRGVDGDGNGDYERCQHLLHGQIWHGRADKTGRRWKRHQWVVERSLVVPRNEGDQTTKS